MDNTLYTGKCDVCGQQAPVMEMPSFLDRNFKYYYCSSCAKEKLEPYSVCVETVFSVGWENLDKQTQGTIIYSLLKMGKTLNDLLEEVAEIDNAYVEWCESELGKNETN